jgi:assimilatory nitrate reductase catalytic subunit
VEVHPLDAMKYSLRHGAIAHLRSQWGQMYGRIVVTDSQRPGDVFVPMHWTEQYATNGRMGAVVNPVVDPISGQPESKHTPVAIRPLAAVWYGFVLARERLSGLTAEYQVSVNAEGYFRYELASLQALQQPAAWAQALLNPQAQCEWQEYEDVAGGIYRAAAYTPAGALQAVVCIAADCGEAVLPTRAWLGSVFALEQVDAPVRAALLAGVPTVGAEDVGSIVCACFNVGEKTIRRAIVEQGCSTYQLVGNCCKAGTNCGSCVPEIKQLIAATAVAGAA